MVGLRFLVPTIGVRVPDRQRVGKYTHQGVFLYSLSVVSE